ncbi:MULTISPECIES: EVE domain-containing protein [unclassified Pseudomonas]|uniref:EVE domain-containing protein n=1 Tax=unclassified Pseudomonas TaxID=196821 RepID=UPI002AC8975D|nr:MULTISPECIES: EVE domain-containing protein [unclassified Pseudomonas]MEB0040285.1 EVE domain-containing protein [Pseudomonas sp. MH10]MEB0077427.1 EVE domain-containing protein [Pseudomonas sp. MH10out]MEB0092792.1 EVE domain-containing protein [Pseudomonas sp. CCI4.2]MEB0101118.1 EVE domain-containing protein [Pseudomonas sp. CCI3.2]MEB0120606.1 EVE domain-containing protein [Pseudomonas sp. CCI1.2]
MAYWLMKSEPEELSIKDLQRLGETRWDGVRNYQARNFMRAMAPDDKFFFYHSSCAQPGIVGIGRIVDAAYPDPTALDPGGAYFDAKSSEKKNRWSAVNVSFVEAFPQVLKISYLKQQSALEQLPLVQKATRLSVMPVSAEQWQAILALL